MCIVSERLDQALNIAVDKCVVQDLVFKDAQLFLRRECAIDEEICHFKKGGVLCEFFNWVALLGGNERKGGLAHSLKVEAIYAPGSAGYLPLRLYK